MCLAIPMQILNLSPLKDIAVAHVDGQERQIDILLLDNVKKEDWVLVLSNQAIKIITAVEAMEIKGVIQAILSGQPYELAEPQLPEHLQKGNEQ